MAQPCPRIDPLRPPSLGRNLPGVLQFGATCLPGTATASGCNDDQKFYALLVPWDQVLANGWIAPGGNRYWQSQVKVTPKDPLATAIIRLMADASKKQFQYIFGKKDDYKKLTMAQVLTKYRTGWVMQYGIARAEVEPNPHETAANFVARGGYLLHADGEFIGKGNYVLDSYKPAWLPSDVKYVQLIASYDPGAALIGYTVRVVMTGSWDKVMRATLGQIGTAQKKFCSTLTGEKAAQAAMAATLYPAATPYAVAWTAAAQMCGLNQLPCEPLPGQPSPAAPSLINTGGGKRGSIVSVGAWLPGTALTTPPPAAPVPFKYPEGTIAWYDAAAAGYRIALPAPGQDTTHQPLVTAAATTVPLGALIVTKREWERATLPWLRRGSTKIGMMIGGIAVASAATVFASRH